MNAAPLLHRHRALRWLLPVGVLGAVGIAATGLFTGTAAPEGLPATTPAALMAAVRTTDVPGFSGTIVSHVALGLPELPGLGGGDSASVLSLLSGSHTLQVWYGGRNRQRIALLGAMDETDLFHYRRQIWQWSSADRVAAHAVLPKQQPAAAARPSASDLPSVTPSGLARDALEALDPSTRVTVRAGDDVADRATYELVLTPRTSATRVGSVHISVDGVTKLPLAVQVYPRRSSTPAIDVGFTSIHMRRPSDTYFQFSPPSDARVRKLGAGLEDQALGLQDGTGVRMFGAGWTRVLQYDSGTSRIAKSDLVRALTPVSGRWGKGHLLETALLSVLVTRDGRILAGTVDPSALYAAAGR